MKCLPVRIGKMTIHHSMRGLPNSFFTPLLAALLLGCAQEPERLVVRGIRLTDGQGDFGKLGDRPHPPYPIAAMRKGIQGRVEVAIEVRRDGSVSKVRVVNGAPAELGNPLIAHITRYWRYSPQTDPGLPELREFTVPFDFVLAGMP
jgi:TonB family protein